MNVAETEGIWSSAHAEAQNFAVIQRWRRMWGPQWADELFQGLYSPLFVVPDLSNPWMMPERRSRARQLVTSIFSKFKISKYATMRDLRPGDRFEPWTLYVSARAAAAVEEDGSSSSSLPPLSRGEDGINSSSDTDTEQEIPEEIIVVDPMEDVD